MRTGMHEPRRWNEMNDQAGETYDRRHRRWIESAIRSAVKNVYALTQGMDEIPWLD